MGNSYTHSPGPWRVDGLLIKALDHGKWYGIAKAGGTKLSIEGNIANAALIAAAPDLLQALEAIMADYDAWQKGDIENPMAIVNEEKAIEAIKQAKGE